MCAAGRRVGPALSAGMCVALEPFPIAVRSSGFVATVQSPRSCLSIKAHIVDRTSCSADHHMEGFDIGPSLPITRRTLACSLSRLRCTGSPRSADLDLTPIVRLASGSQTEMSATTDMLLIWRRGWFVAS